jgi:photosystem II stability/assembly factor-like uncharacterized protein
MKKTLLTALPLCFLFTTLNAQVNAPTDTASYPYWIEMMQDPDANFFETQKAFETYWEGREITPGSGYKPFKRWEYHMQNKVDESGNLPDTPKRMKKAWDYHNAKSPNGNWLELGPNFNQTTIVGDIAGVGRINTVAFHPTDPNTIYAGAPAGGLWVSTDNGSSWNTNTDNLATLGVSALVVDHTDPNIIYIGTGDRDGNDSPGLGVMKSTDGGLTFVPANSTMNNVTVNELIMHPTNSAIVLAGTDGGVYRTDDAGTTWTKTSTIPANYEDIKFKPDDPNVVYAAGSARFYRSVDNGQSFSMINGTGLPSGFRSFIDVSAANPNYVYVLMSNNTTFLGFYRSEDAGLTFSLRSDSPNILGRATDGNDNDGQSWYDLDMAADPLNAEIVYTAGINVWKSIDGGQTWTFNSSGSHVDMHYLEFSPHTNELYLGNDGGLYRSDANNNGWTDISNNMVVGQMYKIGQSATVSSSVLTGFQDNGTMHFDGVSWRRTTGGDGFECLFDQTDDGYRYSTIYYGRLYRSVNGGSYRKIAEENFHGITESGAWLTPFAIAEQNPNIMYGGYKNIWRTTRLKEADRDSVLWEVLSDNLGGNGNNFVVVEHSPADSGLFYCAKTGSNLFRADSIYNPAGQITWANLVSSGFPIGGNITDIEAHPTDPDIVYVTKGTGVLKSIDRGQSWTDITGTLPGVTMTCLVYDITSNEGIYVGSEGGIFYKDASMSDWISFSDGFPMAADVRELEIYYDADPTKSRIRVGTYGRGLWESDLYSATTNNFPATAMLSTIEANMAGNVYEPFDVNIQFYNNLEYMDVNGFDVNDIQFGNCTLSDFSGGPETFTVTVTPGSFGEVWLYIPDAAAIDINGLNTLLSDTFKVAYLDAPIVLGYQGPGGVGDQNSLAIWLRAEMGLETIPLVGGNPVTTDGDRVGEWQDQSGNGLTASQILLLQRPTWRTGSNGINDRPAVEFNPINDSTGQHLIAANVVPGGHFSVFTLTQSNNMGFNDHGWITSSREDNGFILHNSKNTTAFYAHVRDEDGSSLNGQNIGAGDITAPHIYGFVYSYNSVKNYLRSFMDNRDFEKENTSLDPRDPAGQIDIQYGQDRDDRFGDGKMSEHFIFNAALNRAQQTIVKNYLGSKFGIYLEGQDVFEHDNIYPNDVAGIGQYDAFHNHLDAQGTGIVRVSNPTQLSDGEYLLWGHDNQSTNTWVDQLDLFETQHIERKWRVDMQGDVGQVTLRIKQSELPATTDLYAVLFSTDGTFETGITAATFQLVNDTLSTTLEFDDDAYFTIITATQDEIDKINEDYSELSISVYPSPNAGTFSIDVRNPEFEKAAVSIYNSVGQLIDYRIIDQQRTFLWQVALNSSGTYVVKYESDDQVVTKKVVVY